MPTQPRCRVYDVAMPSTQDENQRLQPIAERIGGDLEAALRLLDTLESDASRPAESWQALLQFCTLLGQVQQSTQELTSALRSRKREIGIPKSGGHS